MGALLVLFLALVFVSETLHGAEARNVRLALKDRQLSDASMSQKTSTAIISATDLSKGTSSTPTTTTTTSSPVASSSSSTKKSSSSQASSSSTDAKSGRESSEADGSQDDAVWDGPSDSATHHTYIDYNHPGSRV